MRFKEVLFFQLNFSIKVLDLLSHGGEDLRCISDKSGTSIPELSEVQLKNHSHFMELYSAGCSARARGTTTLNSSSSRSHAVLIIKVTEIDVLNSINSIFHRILTTMGKHQLLHLFFTGALLRI